MTAYAPIPVPLELTPADVDWYALDLHAEPAAAARAALAHGRSRWGRPGVRRGRRIAAALAGQHRAGRAAGADRAWLLWRDWERVEAGVLLVGEDRPPGARLSELAGELGALPGQRRPPQVEPFDLDGQGGLRVVRITDEAVAQTLLAPVPGGSGSFVAATAVWTAAQVHHAPGGMHDTWALLARARWVV